MSNRFAALASESSGEGREAKPKRKKRKAAEAAEATRKRPKVTVKEESQGGPLAEGTEKSLPGGVTIKAGARISMNFN